MQQRLPTCLGAYGTDLAEATVMEHRLSPDDLAHTYLLAKYHVLTAGFADEIRWQKYRSSAALSECDVLAEAAWVILNGGMRETVIRGLFPRVCEAFLQWESAKAICARRKYCVSEAARVFNHVGKLEAIVTFASAVAETGHEALIDNLRNEGTDYLRRFPYLGPATAKHLAKNLGCDVAKPDRHLMRIANATGHDSPASLCSAISTFVDDSVSVIDLVLWRFATLHREYCAFFTRQ